MATKKTPKAADLEGLGLREWTKIHANFKYADPMPIRDRIKAKGPKAYPEDHDIINSIVLWKINRQVELDAETIEYLNSLADALKQPDEALTNEDAAWLVGKLIESKGVGLPVASAILKQYCPHVFPIIDQRAYFVLYREKLPLNAGVDIYLAYLDRCATIAKEYKIPFDKVDEVLYQIDKDSGHKLNSTGDE